MDKVQILKTLETFLKTQKDNTFSYDVDTTLDLILCGESTATKLVSLYVTEQPRRAEDNIILISQPIANACDVNDVDCLSHFSLVECEQICDVTFRQYHKREYHRVQAYLNKNNADYDDLTQTTKGFEISVNWGDWKHSHIFLDHLMKELGYTLINEEITEENGDDAYSSIHVYMKI
jgi:hypothetical protein